MYTTPTTTTFELGDWNPRHADMTEVGAASITDSVNGLVLGSDVGPGILGVSDGVAVAALAADSSHAALARLRLPVPGLTSDYTLEFTVSMLTELGAISAQARTFVALSVIGLVRTGLLLTTHGIAIADGINDPAPRIIPGTRPALFGDSGAARETTTIRTVFDAASSTLRVYTSNDGAGYAATPDLISASIVAQTVLPQADVAASILDIQTYAPAGAEVVAQFESIRLSASQRTPTLLPTCQIVGPATGTLDEAPRFFAEAADPIGLPLTYEWDVIQRPAGSALPRMGAGANSYVVIGTSATNTEIRVSLRAQSAEGNGWELVFVKQSRVGGVLTSEVDLSGKRVTFALPVDGAGAVSITSAEVLAAFESPAAAGGDYDITNLFIATNVDATTDLSGTPTVATYTLGGGAASTTQSPVLLVQTPGMYVLQLRVYNGYLWSTTQTATYLAAKSDQLLGGVPNTDYIFKYIGDFWDIVGDKEPVTEFWSAAAQVIGAELLQAWQLDAAQFIQEASPVIHRKWLHYDFSVDVSDQENVLSAQEAHTVTATIASGTLSGTSARAVTTQPITSRSPLKQGAYVLVETAMFAPQVARVESLAGGTDVTLSEFEARRVIASGTLGRFIDDPSLATTPPTSTLFHDSAFTRFDGVRGGLILRLGGVAYVVQVSESGVVTLPAAFPQDGSALTWELLENAAEVTLRTAPSISIEADVLQGDIAQVQYTLPGSIDEVSVYLRVIASSSTRLFLDWAPLVAITAAQQGGSATLEDAIGIYHTVINVYQTALSSTVVDGLISVPRLSDTPSADPVYEGAAYVVEADSVRMLPTVSGKAAAIAGSDVLEVTTHALLPGTQYADLPEVLVGKHVYFNGGRGSARIRNVSWPRITLDTVSTETGDLQFFVPSSDADVVPAARRWAEMSVLSGVDRIERNFGLLVGLPRTLFDAAVSPSHYLAAVRASTYALVTGPTFSNIKMALEAILGSPVALESGVVTSIKQDSDSGPGFVANVLDSGVIQVIPYLSGSKISVNPATGNVYGTSVPGLPTELVDQAYADARSAPFRPIVENVSIDDYLTDPLAIEFALGEGQIPARNHTFIVRVPARMLGWDGVWDALTATIELTKPAHTAYVLYGTVNIADDLAITAELDYAPTLILADSLVTSLFAGPEAHPTDETLGRGAGPAGAWNADDVLEKYESGYVSGVLDDFSGDGSLNTRQGQMHYVNTIDSDIDVVRSRLMVPILKDVAGTQADIEFEYGELVEIIDAVGTVVGWDSARPAIAHIGSSTHPKLPFAIYNPQVAHKYTYLLLAFHTPAHAGNVDSGVETRLNAIDRATAIAVGALRIRGVTSGALADVREIPDLYKTAHIGKYFFLRNIFEADLLKDIVPFDAVSMRVSFYAGWVGTTLKDIDALGAPFDPSLLPNLGHQVQTDVYDPAVADNAQYVPSFDPGLFLDFDLSAATHDVGGGPADRSNVYLRWGYTDAGDVLAAPKNLNTYLMSATDPLQNVWVGAIRGAAPDYHYTHGFKRANPHDPIAEDVELVTATQVRVHGWYFIAPDVTAANPPDITAPATYSGTYPGAWLYLRRAGVYYPLLNVAAELGTAIGRLVLGADGAVQTSTGHILTGDLPAGLPEGMYDVVVANFSPYKTSAAAAVQVELTGSVLSEALNIVAAVISGLGTGGLGATPLGS